MTLYATRFMLILTKHLYPKDEAIVALTTALLSKRNLQECYYWAFELHTSGFDVSAILWQLYVDFYYERNPELQDYVEKKTEKIQQVLLEVQLELLGLSQDQDQVSVSKAMTDEMFVYMACVIRNMFRASPSPTVFCWRQYVLLACAQQDPVPPPPCQLQLPNWLERSYPPTTQPLILAIAQQDWPTMCYHLMRLLWYDDNANLVINSLAQYFHYNETFQELQTRARTGWQTNPLVMSLLAIARSCTLAGMIHHEARFIQVTSNQLPDFDDLHFTPTRTIAAFDLARWQVSVEDLATKWEKYTIHCPYWANKAHDVGATVDDSTEELVFPHSDAWLNFVNEDDQEPQDVDLFNDGYQADAASWVEWWLDVFPDYPAPTHVLPPDYKLAM